MECLETHIKTAKRTFTQETQRAFTFFRANFQKVAASLLPAYEVDVVQVEQENSEEIAAEDGSHISSTGLQFSLHGGSMRGTIAELSGGTL